MLMSVLVCIYLLCPSKMPWNLPPWGSSWSSRWLRCMSSGLLELPPGAWSWWHQQGSPARPPVHLRRRFTTDIMKHFHYAHSDHRAWDRYSCIVWCDKGTEYTWIYSQGIVRLNGLREHKWGGNQNVFLGEENVTCLCLDVHRHWAFQMFVTCNSSSSEQLQSPQLSVFICYFLLAVGINREVDGGEGDVTQEASFGSLTGKKKINSHIYKQYIMATVMCTGSGWGGLSKGLRGAVLFSLQGAWVLMMEPESPQAELQHWASREKSIIHTQSSAMDPSSAKRKSALFFFFF